jgi:hypothetical protein
MESSHVRDFPSIRKSLLAQAEACGWIFHFSFEPLMQNTYRTVLISGL